MYCGINFAVSGFGLSRIWLANKPLLHYRQHCAMMLPTRCRFSLYCFICWSSVCSISTSDMVWFIFLQTYRINIAIQTGIGFLSEKNLTFHSQYVCLYPLQNNTFQFISKLDYFTFLKHLGLCFCRK